MAAEAAGADSLWTWDHFFQSGAGEDPTGPNFECMTLLAALAGATSRAQPRRARRLQLLPQSPISTPTWRARSTTSAAAASCSASERAGSSPTTPSTATPSAARATASMRSPRRSRACATASTQPLAAAGARPPSAAHRRRRRARPAAPRRGVRGPLELLRDARRDGAQERHPRRALREHRARSGRDRAHGAARGATRRPSPRATTRLA